MENKVYIVTSGEYSDYHVDAVFSTKEMAEDFVQNNGTQYEIEEIELDTKINRDTKVWRVEFRKNFIGNYELECAMVAKDKEIKFSDTCTYRDAFFNKFILFVNTETKDKAIKIANERFMAIKANQVIWDMLVVPVGKTGFGRFVYPSFNVVTNKILIEEDIY